MSAKSVVAKQVNRALRPLNFQIIPGKSTAPGVRPYRSARHTMAEARKADLSVSAWIDQTYAEPGATPALVKAMLSISGLSGKCGRVCEIGPGTGRYAEEVIAALQPDAYEIYETARDWIPVLRKLPNAIIQHCDGRTLFSNTGRLDRPCSRPESLHLPPVLRNGRLHRGNGARCAPWRNGGLRCGKRGLPRRSDCADMDRAGNHLPSIPEILGRGFPATSWPDPARFSDHTASARQI